MEYLKPSPIQSSPIDLPRFPLVDIEPILMDQHEQDPLGHVLGGAHNAQQGINKEVEDHEKASNVGEVKAQMRTIKDYMNFTRQTPISATILFAHHTTLNLKPGMLQVLPQFHGCESERPYTYLKDFEDVCSIIQDNSNFFRNETI